MTVSAHHLGGLVGPLFVVPVIWLLLRWSPFRRAWQRTDVVSRTAAVLFLLASGIHFGLVNGHAGERGLATLFFLNGAGFVLAFAAVFLVRWWRWPAGFLLVATIAAYLVYIGTGRDGVDEVGVLSKLIELTALGLVLAPRSGQARRRVARWSLAIATFLLMTVITGTVAWAADLRPEHPHADEWGPPTPAQQAAAQKLIEDTTLGIARYRDPQVAIADGYHRDQLGANSATDHWTNPKYEHGSRMLDPQHPETLVYANAAHGPVLLGAMYTSHGPGKHGPRPGGSLTTWHTHNNICISLAGFQLAGLESPLGGCPIGTFSIQTEEMMHVWIVPNPKGPFAEDIDDSWVKKQMTA